MRSFRQFSDMMRVDAKDRQIKWQSKKVDLYLLYQAVQEKGGYKRVIIAQAFVLLLRTVAKRCRLVFHTLLLVSVSLIFDRKLLSSTDYNTK